MLKSLYTQVDWDGVHVIGFDMDGTLYDEAEFIAQVYRPIAAVIAGHTGHDAQHTYSLLLRRWLEKGSSYNRIFDDALRAVPLADEVVRRTVGECLSIFRGFAPILTLPARVSTILSAMQERFSLFLISDGNPRLQRRKFDSLGLERWFPSGSVGFTGALGSGYDKPDVKVLDQIALLAGVEPCSVVFFGDRSVDAQFAANAGFQFVPVACLQLAPLRMAAER